MFTLYRYLTLVFHLNTYLRDHLTMRLLNRVRSDRIRMDKGGNVDEKGDQR